MTMKAVRSDVVHLNELYDGCTNFVCPVCDSDYMHQREVIIYDREEDEEFVSKTTVLRGLTATHLVPNENSGNLSERRHGVAIVFDCEGCRHRPTLHIAQHKGVTLVFWTHSTTDVIRDEDRLF